MDRRTLLAITLSFLIFVLWQKFYLEPRMPVPGSPQVTQTLPPSGAPTGSAPQTPSKESPSALSPAPTTPARTIEKKTIITGTGDAIISNGADLITQWNLKAYRVGMSEKAANVDLTSVTNQGGQLSFAFDDPAFAYLSGVVGEFEQLASGTGWKYEDANVKLTREVTASAGQSYMDVRISADFKSKRPSFAFVSLSSATVKGDPEEQDRQLFYWTNNAIERVNVSNSLELKEIPTSVKYVGASNRYFVFAAVAQGPFEPKGLLQGIGPGAGKLSLVYPVQGNSISIPTRVYFGPKELELLRSVEPKLDHTVDFGWFTAFAYPLLKLLKWFYSYFHNYGIAIILLTLVIKIVTYPLTYKSVKSMKEMAKIQPQLQRVREKYKDDKEALNREMLTLMRSHGYNPLAGCLPILIQMPIFFALYRVLYGSIELYHAPFALWIQDLSAKDPYYVTPILLTGFMYIQQRLTPQTTMDPAQQKMMQFMPVVFGLFMLALPSGLGIYMLVNAIASIIQQLILNKKFEDPKYAPAR